MTTKKYSSQEQDKEVCQVKDFKKVVRIGTIKTYGENRSNVFCKIEFKEGKLSITGVVGPKSNRDAHGGCGQIDMEFMHKNPLHNDARTTYLITPDEINFAPNWNETLWYKFLEVWKLWHLNDLHAECEHQRALGWTYQEHSDPKTFIGEKCPTCGYSIGSKWLKVDVPQEITDWLKALPSTDIIPAWV
jgi:hypothetical protein